jgi:hypothetical protein
MGHDLVVLSIHRPLGHCTANSRRRPNRYRRVCDLTTGSTRLVRSSDPPMRKNSGRQPIQRIP